MSKAKRAKAFKFEQAECIGRLRKMIDAIQSGDMYEANRWNALVLVSVKHLNDNDPRGDNQ